MPCGKSGGEGNGNPPGKTGVNEDYVSLSTLWELLDPQKLFYKDMLDLHEKNFKTFLTVIMETTNKQIHDLVKDVLDFKQYGVLTVRDEGIEECAHSQSECLQIHQ